MKLYTCNACRYTFPAESLPDRCPDCGKATANVKVCIGGKNILRSVPAIRESTDTEAAEYERIKKEIEKELAAEQEQKNIAASRHIKCKDLAEHPSEEYLAFLRDVYNIM